MEIAGDGVTHQGTEDLAILRTMPNMVVLPASDPVTTRLAPRAIAQHKGPCYMRLGRQTRKVLHTEDVHVGIGKAIQLRDGDDVAIIACGDMAEAAMIAAANLARDGIEALVLDSHTIKSTDREAIVSAACETAGIITAEDHNIVGSLVQVHCQALQILSGPGTRCRATSTISGTPDL